MCAGNVVLYKPCLCDMNVSDRNKAKKRSSALLSPAAEQPRRSNQIKLPGQLASVILSTQESANTPASLNQVVTDLQKKHVKELASYVRAVCMRLDLHCENAQL